MQGFCFPTLWMASQLLQEGQTKLDCDDGNKRSKREYLDAYCHPRH